MITKIHFTQPARVVRIDTMMPISASLTAGLAERKKTRIRGVAVSITNLIQAFFRITTMTYTVTITRPGYGRYSGGSYITSQTFVDEKKARDYYTDMLLKYPNYNVELLKSE